MKRILTAAIFWLVGISTTLAQVPAWPQTLPASTVVGRLGIGSGPSQAIPFATLYSNLFSSLCTTSGAFPIYNATTARWVCSTTGGTGSVANLTGTMTVTGAANINGTAASTTPALIASNGSPAGSATSFALNQINVGLDTPDAINAGATPANNALRISHRYGNPLMQGGRQSLAVQSVLTGPSNAADALPQYVAGSFLAQGNANAGGTSVASLANTKAAMYAINPICTLVNGATNYSECTGAEFNIDMHTGSSAWYAAVASFAPSPSHAVQGTYYDASIAISSGSTTGSKVGILFGPMNTYHPVSSTGTLIGTTIANRSGSGTVAATVDKGIDFSNYTITTAFLKGPNSYSVDGSGNTLGGTYNKVTITAPASGSTLTIADGKTLTTSNSGTLAGGDAWTLAIAASKTLTASNTLTFTGTDGTSFAFPNTSSTVATLGQTQTFTGVNTINNSTNATSSSTGAVVISGGGTGGLGVAGNIHGGGYIQPGTGSFFSASNGRFYNNTSLGLVITAHGGSTNDITITGRGGATIGGVASNANDWYWGDGTTNSHVRAGGSAPALTSCGTSPAISGSDISGEVTMGTGSPTGCVITFNRAYTSAPYCAVTWQATPLASQSYAVSNTAITLTQTATSSNKVNYYCLARSGG